MRDSMVFYRSFAEALSELPAEEYKEAVQSMLDYALDGKEPECNGVAKALFIMAKPQIDANNKRYENGKKGGKKAKAEPNLNQTETKSEPKANQDNTNAEPNDNVNVNVNVNDNVNANVNANDNANVNENGNVNANAYSCAFEQTWQIYPRKKEKAAAYKAYKARLKDYTEPELDLAARRYAEECRILGTEERYIKHGATFFGPSLPFVDYLADDYHPPEPSRGMNRPRSGTGEMTKEEYLASWGLAPDGRTEL